MDINIKNLLDLLRYDDVVDVNHLTVSEIDKICCESDEEYVSSDEDALGEDCDINYAPSETDEDDDDMVIYRTSKLCKIRYRLLSMVESGIMEHRVQEDLPGASICPLNLDSKDRQLRNSDLWTTYLIVMSGFSSAFTVFVAELVWRRCIAPSHPRHSWPLDVSLHHNPKGFSIDRFGGGNTKNHSKVHINGREYYIVITKNGEKRYIPIRTPSALLFQYAPK